MEVPREHQTTPAGSGADRGNGGDGPRPCGLRRRHGSRFHRRGRRLGQGDDHQARRGRVLQGPHQGLLGPVRHGLQDQDGQHPRGADRQLGRHRPAELDDGPEQQPPGHPQPQRLRELRQGRPALQLGRRAVRLGQVRPARRVREVGHLQGQDVRHAGPVLGAGPVLQQDPLQGCRHRRAAEDVGRVRGRRQEGHRPRQGQHRLRPAARTGGGPGRVLHLAVQQRR